MNDIYRQGYSDALVKLGLDAEKTARLGGIKRLMTGAKGLLGGMKTKAQGVMSRFGRGRMTAPSDVEANQALSALRNKPAPVGPVTGGAPKTTPAPASRIQQFESKMQGQTPPQTPKSWPQQQKLKQPAASAPGEVASAPPGVTKDVLPTAAAAAEAGADVGPGAAEEAAATLQNAPEESRARGLLTKGLKWGLPTAAVGAGIYGITRGQQPAPAPEQYYGEQYAPQYAGAAPMY